MTDENLGVSFSCRDHGIEVLPLEGGGSQAEMSFRSRTFLPEIKYGVDLDDAYDVIKRGGIVALENKGRHYYEGLDHNEALLMVKDYREKTNDHRPINLVNIDDHHDIFASSSDSIGIGNWIRYADKLGWLKRGVRRLGGLLKGCSQFTWINRLSRMEEDKGKVLVDENFNATEIDMTYVTLDDISVDGTNEASVFVKGLIDDKSKSELLVTSIDLDAGRGENPNGNWDRDLFGTEWLRNLVAQSDVVIVIHSPTYADPKYAEEQAERFRGYFMAA